MDVSVIIVSYNTQALLKQCLASLFANTHDVGFEVIVVDNASHDGSPQMVRNKFPGVMLIESHENLGFGRANNLGAEHANGKYLFLLNPDTIVLNNAVKTLFDFIDHHPNVGICGGNLFDADRKPAMSYQMFLPSLFWELDVLFSGLPAKWRYGKSAGFNHTRRPREVGYITGADLMIRTDLFRRLNGFDPDFFMYYEETELTFRVRKAGYAVYSVPQAEIIHLEGKTFSGSGERVKLLFDSRKKYYRKTQTRFTTWICDSILLFCGLHRCCLFALLGNRKKVKYWKYIIRHTL
jgi:GT2 family glycosyltransferase